MHAPTKRIRVFESIEDYRTFLESPPTCTGGLSHETGYSAESFRGTKDWKTAVDLSHGWNDGAESIETISNPIVEAIASKIERLDVVHDVEGMGIDVARYLDGEPECWQRFETTYVEGKGTRVLRLVFNGGARAGVSKEVITSKGSLICALIQCLEYAGYRVEVWYGFASESYTGGKLECHVKVKDADQPVDMPRMAYILAHPSMLRRLGFSFLEHMPANLAQFRVSTSYGSPADVSLTGDITISKSFYHDSQWNTPESARKWIIAELKKQGISLREE